MLKTKKIFFLVIFLLIGAGFAGGPATAQSSLISNDGGTPFSSDECLESGKCEVSDFTVILIRVSQIILGLTGSLALLAFIYGGLLFMVSAGNKERVEKAKSTLVGAVIGVFIVFASYTIIGFVFSAFQIPGGEHWSNSAWFSGYNPH